MTKKLLLLSHLCTGRKMKIIFLIVNTFVLVKTQNETGSISPSLNNTELATDIDNSTTTVSTNASIISNITTNHLNTTINATTQTEINSSSSSGNNTEQATINDLTSTSITSNTTTSNPNATNNITTQQEINSSSTSGNNTESVSTTDLTSTSIDSTTTIKTNFSSASENTTEPVTTTILPSKSITSNTTTSNPGATNNITTQQEMNSTSTSANGTEPVSTTDLTSTSIDSTTTIKTNFSSTSENTTKPVTTTTQQELNSSSTSGNNTEPVSTTDLTSTSINSTTIKTNFSSTSGNNTEQITTTIFPSTSITSNTTTNTNPNVTVNVTNQEGVNSSNSTPGNNTDLATTTSIPSKNETIPTSPSKNTTEPTTTPIAPAKPIIQAKPQKPQQNVNPTSPPITEQTTTPTNSTSTVSTFTPLNSKDWPHTQILTKKNVNLRDHTDQVQIAVPEDGDFLSFIRHSSFWVDKSLLIPKICGVWNDKSTTLQLSKGLMFPTAPPKWGKTINLSMLKFYFELPTNSDGFPIPKEESASYRYFKEGKVILEDGSIQELDGIPLISQHGSRNLANHPVIWIKGANYTGNLDSFKVMIHEAFQRHEGLLKRLKSKLETAQVASLDYNVTSKQIQDFLNFYDWDKMKNETSDVRLQKSIETLSEILSKVYESSVAILFDDYDYYIYDTFFNLDHFDETIATNNFSDFFENFMSNTFKYNEFRTFAVITGVIRANFPNMFTSFDNYHRSYVDSVSLFPFYGIFQPEFEQMVQKRGIDRALVDHATHWYGGYYALGNLQTQMYSTHSVTRFISTLEIRNYWPKTRTLGQFFNNLLRKPELRRDVLNFTQSLDGHTTSSSILYARFRKLSLEDYKVIRRIQLGSVDFQEENHEYEYVHVRHRDLIFSLMVSEGYAAVHDNQTGAVHYDMPVAVNITMPNREIYDLLSHITNPK